MKCLFFGWVFFLLFTLWHSIGQSPAFKQKLFLDLDIKQNTIQFKLECFKIANKNAFFFLAHGIFVKKSKFYFAKKQMCDAHSSANVNQHISTASTHFTYLDGLFAGDLLASFHANRPIARWNVKKKTSFKRILIQFSNVILLCAIAKCCFLLCYQHTMYAWWKSERSFP